MRKILIFLLLLSFYLPLGTQQKEETLLPAPRQLPVEIILGPMPEIKLGDFTFTWLPPKEREFLPLYNRPLNGQLETTGEQEEKKDFSWLDDISPLGLRKKIYMDNDIYDSMLPYMTKEDDLLFRPRREKNSYEQELWQIEKQKKELLELLDDVEEARHKLESDLFDYQTQLGFEKINFESDLIQSWFEAKSMIRDDIWMDRWLSMTFPKTYRRKFNRIYLDYTLLYYLFFINPFFK